MGTKTISIMDDVYEMLAENKSNNESFSDVIRKCITKNKDISEYAGIWSDMTDAEAEDMKNTIKKVRKSKRRYLSHW